MPRIIKYALCILLLPIYCVSFAIPRNRNIWVFGCWHGQKFADNSKYIFLYTKKIHPEIRAIWLTHNTNVLKEVRKKGYEAYKAFSLKGFLYSMKAGCVVICTCLEDVNGFAVGKAKIIQLCHGTPLKKLGYDSELNLFLMPNKRKGRGRTTIAELANKVYPLSMFRYDVLTAGSEEAKKKLGSAFRESKNRLQITGYPRNDALFDTDWLAHRRCDYIDNVKKQVRPEYVITYLPTHRQFGKKRVDLFAKYGFQVSEAQQMLESLNAVFIVKAHYKQQKLRPSVRNEPSRRIYTLSDEELPDIYPLLKETHILITDYSSVYFDYLLLNRPIIFTPFDIEEYTREEGLYYDYNEVTPGPKAKDWSEVFKLIPEIIQNDHWKQEREAVCNRFNKFRDNKSSERVFQAIRELVE